MMLKALGCGNTELSLLVTGDAGVQTVTADWCGGAQITDVLSFPQDELPGPDAFQPPPSDGPPQVLGDIVINLDEARRRGVPDSGAEPLGVSAGGDPPATPRDVVDPATLAEIDRLLAHGLCHLVGYDHERSESEADAMRARERELLAVVREA